MADIDVVRRRRKESRIERRKDCTLDKQRERKGIGPDSDCYHVSCIEVHNNIRFMVTGA